MTDPSELPPRLRIDRSMLLKPNGEEWIGRGVSLGHFWLDTPQDIPAIAALDANCVRILLRWWAPPHGQAGRPNQDARDDNAYAFIHREHFRNWIDLILSASAAGLWVIPAIDSNCGQSGTQNPETMKFCDPYGVFGARGRNFWTDIPMRRLYASVWQSAAAILRLIPRIAMLEIQPEPLAGRGPEMAEAVRDFYDYVDDAISEVDPDTPRLVGPRDGYNIMLCQEAFNPKRGNRVYTGNLLNQYVVNPQKFDDALRELSALRVQEGVPVFIQQLGRKTENDRDLSLMRRALDVLNSESIGFAWWAWKQSGPSPDEYSLNYPSADGTTWIAKQAEQNLLAEYL